MSFPLVGNLKIKTALTNALRENRLPHAIIIEGDVGTGRHTLASFIAAAAVCSGENIPCGSCRNCQLQKAGSHPDILVTAPEDGKKNIAVSQIRSLKNEVYVKPHMANTRVFVIDFADTMNVQSQNALLKVLEEPPTAAVFLLLTESKAALLETIISRCVVLTLSVPEFDVALKHLEGATEYPSNEIAAALTNSQNNIGKALHLLSGKEDDKPLAAAKEFLEGFLRNDSFGMLSITCEFEKNRAAAESFFKSLKYCVAEALRRDPEGRKAATFTRLYSELCLLEKSLASNINLSLLFSALVSKITVGGCYDRGYIRKI